MSTAVLPLNVAALRVNANDADLLTGTFKGRTARFERVATASTGDELLQPLDDPSGPANALGVGVHLHWELPDLFARGQQPSPDSAFVFPPAPNRWLVLRYLALTDPASGAVSPPTTQRWVIESDAVLTALAADKYGIVRPAVPFPLPATTAGSAPAAGSLGRVVEYTDWLTAPAGQHLKNYPGPDGTPLHLSAVGFVGPGFSAYYPECCSVFGFWDSFADVPGLRARMLQNQPVRFDVSYQVIGWVDDPGADPLATLASSASTAYAARVEQCRAANVPVDTTPSTVVAQLLDRDHRLSIRADAVSYTLDSAADLMTLDAPTRTLCSGVLQELVWDTGATPATTFFLANPDVPGDPTAIWSDAVRLAAGNTAAEGLSALLRNDAGNTQDDADVLDNDEFLLNALQLGLLNGLENKTNRIVDLEEQLHAAAYGRVPGGLLWIVQPPGTDPTAEQEVTLPLAVAEKLNALNVAQQAYDSGRAQLEIQRRQLFADWFRYLKVYLGEITDPNVDLNALVRFLGSELSDVVAAGSGVGVLPLTLDPLTQEVTSAGQPTGTGTSAAAVWQAYQDAAAALPANAGAASPTNAGWLLRAVPAPPFWLPNDPVLVIEGQRAQPIRRNGTADRPLLRVGAELVSVLEMSAAGSTFALPATSVAGPPLVAAALPDPTTLNGLIAEAAVLLPALAPSCADAVAASGGTGNPAIADRAGFITALRSATGGANPLTGLYAAVHSADLPPSNPVQSVTTPQQLSVTFTNAGNDAYPPDPVGWNAPMLLPEFAATRTDPFLPVFLTWQASFTPLPRRSGVDYTADNLTAGFALDSDGVDNTYPVTGGKPAAFAGGVAVTYSGSTVLAKRPTLNLTRQIQLYLQDHPDDPAAATLTGIASLYAGRHIMTQALSGFTLQQTLRTGIPAVPVRDVRRTRQDAVTASIAAAASADSWYSTGSSSQAPIATGLLAQNNFGPLRAGPLTIRQLEIVDVFGQRMTLQTPPQPPPLSVLPARRLRPSAADTTSAGSLMLPPRLAVPTRLAFRWISAGSGSGSPDEFVESNAHPATSPIFGWVLPNHLEDALAFYDSAGNPIGSFGIEHGNRVYRSRPGNAANPGDDLATDIGPANAPTISPHLAAVLWGIQEAGDGFLTDLLATLLASDAWMAPSTSGQENSLAVLIGRPLALARAVLGLQTRGGLLPLNPASTDPAAPFPQDVGQQRFRYRDRQATSSAALGDVRIPVRLGDVANLDDGLVGYFLDAGGAVATPPFYSPYAPANAVNGVLVPHPEPLDLMLNAAPTPVLMLLDPRAAVHATTGLLPVEQLTIPPDQYLQALRGLAVTFTAHPLLHAQPALTVPLPRVPGYDWSWIVPGAPAPVPLRAERVDGSPRTDYGPQVIDEGWLQLRPTPPDATPSQGS